MSITIFSGLKFCLCDDNFSGNIFDTIKSGGKDEDNDLARNKLKLLRLDNDAIWAREENRAKIKAPWVIKVPYVILCYFLDVLFGEYPMAR